MREHPSRHWRESGLPVGLDRHVFKTKLEEERRLVVEKEGEDYCAAVETVFACSLQISCYYSFFPRVQPAIVITIVVVLVVPPISSRRACDILHPSLCFPSTVSIVILSCNAEPIHVPLLDARHVLLALRHQRQGLHYQRGSRILGTLLLIYCSTTVNPASILRCGNSIISSLLERLYEYKQPAVKRSSSGRRVHHVVAGSIFVGEI